MTETFPFDAWDMIEHKRVTVVGRYDAHCYRLKSGYLARIDSVTTVFPKRTSAYYHGYEDGHFGAAPDYSQYDAASFQDYRDGYRDGKAEAAR